MHNKTAEKVPAGGFKETRDTKLHAGINRIYIPEDRIAQKVHKMAEWVVSDFPDYIHAVIILKGATVFASDLFRNIAKISYAEIYHSFVKASSYGDSTHSIGAVDISHEIHEIKDRDVLIVEDIIDTGLTLAKLKDYLLNERQANSVRTCCLLDKKCCRLPDFSLEVDYTGFEIENHFFVGYGLDYAERFRELPYIGILDESVTGV